MHLPIKSLLPIYTCQLPSYEKMIEYRPYIMKEENVLMIANESGDIEQMTKAVRNLLTSCTFEKIDIDVLPTFDIEYLWLMIRAKSRGEEIKINMKCNAVNKDGIVCEHSNVVDFNLVSNVKVKRNPEHQRKIMLTSTAGIVLSYPTLSAFVSNQEDADKTSQRYDMLIKNIVESVEIIFDEENEYTAREYPQEEIREYIENLTEQQFTKVKTFFDTMPRIVGEISFTCKKCKYKHNNIEVSGLHDFLS